MPFRYERIVPTRGNFFTHDYPVCCIGVLPWSTRNVRCTVTEPTTGTVYNVDANYRGVCSYAHDTREEHLCDLTLRVGPMDEPDAPFTVCDLAAVPTPVLVAIQGRLRAILARAATTAPAPAQRAAPLVLSTGRR